MSRCAFFWTFFLAFLFFFCPKSCQAISGQDTDGNKAGEMTKVGSADEDLSVILKDIVLDEERTSAFAVLPNDAPLYRRFLTEEGKDEAQLLKFYEYYKRLSDGRNERKVPARRC